MVFTDCCIRAAPGATLWELRADRRCGPVAREEIRMQTDAPSLNAALTLSAMTWPLMAGLSVVMWSKARAWRARTVHVRVRSR